MKLSIVIVNYNVCNFLRNCLLSVQKATEGMECEVFIVDNNSQDDSLAMMEREFPQYTIIANQENMGFSKANNQAIRIAKGEYVLLLNPDTVVEPDTFSKTTSFLDAHPEAGALGVRMVNAEGAFLPESKRGLPTPLTAFYKMCGLASLFPKSKHFGRYHLKYIDEFATTQVDVLSGAFMMLRKSVLDQIGLLDEQFFMYAEDIDLSYRITQAGYFNYYYPECTILHYKGESTKKNSMQYVYMFYKAMAQFVQKHFFKNCNKFCTSLILCGIWIRAGIAAIRRIVVNGKNCIIAAYKHLTSKKINQQ